MIQLDVGPKPVTSPVATGFEPIKIKPLGRTIGAVVQGVSLGDVSEDARNAIDRALLEWKVLFFPDQDLSQHQHREFAERWGPVEQHPFFKFVHPQEAPDVVRLAKDENMSGFENEWHNDVTWSSEPSFGAVLRAIEVPELGGDTMWSDTAAAYDGLPEPLRERISDLRAVHTWRKTFGQAMTPEQIEEFSAIVPEVQHPVVITHPRTGRRHLFVNRYFTDQIVGVSAEESADLLENIYHQIARPEYQVRYHWRPGDVAFWDNLSCQHYAVSDYSPHRRVMDRISVSGSAL